MKVIELSDSESDEELIGKGIMRDNVEQFTPSETFDKLVEALTRGFMKTTEKQRRLKDENKRTLERIKKATQKRVSEENKPTKRKSKKTNIKI